MNTSAAPQCVISVDCNSPELLKQNNKITNATKEKVPLENICEYYSRTFLQSEDDSLSLGNTDEALIHQICCSEFFGRH